MTRAATAVHSASRPISLLLLVSAAIFTLIVLSGSKVTQIASPFGLILLGVLLLLDGCAFIAKRRQR
jgi:hypothetical protein